MFSSDRNEYRKVFFDAWRKHRAGELLEPVEAQLIEIIALHPEYYSILNDPATYQEKDYDAANPFLHMSLHLGIREQVSTDRPKGIKQIYQSLCQKYQDVHMTEHKMMEHLAKILWEAQQNGKMPDEEVYIEGLKKL